MRWTLWLRYDSNAQESKVGTWSHFTTGSMEEILDDLFEWRSGRLHGYDAVRMEAERVQ